MYFPEKRHQENDTGEFLDMGIIGARKDRERKETVIQIQELKFPKNYEQSISFKVLSASSFIRAEILLEEL